MLICYICSGNFVLVKISFSKYHGSGNDFILIDNRREVVSENQELISLLCDRHRGIGADGLMLLYNHTELDFSMKYFNADGREGTMCGNGGRCIAFFAYKLGISGKNTAFSTIDGVHRAEIKSAKAQKALVSIGLNDVTKIKEMPDGYFLDTGSPHFVKFVTEMTYEDVQKQGKELRHDSRFCRGGTNVNFVQIKSADSLFVRTYERGVENETLSCGTGVTAAAIVAAFAGKIKGPQIKILTNGGELKVTFEQKERLFSNILLEGPAEFVYKGEIEAI